MQANVVIFSLNHSETTNAWSKALQVQSNELPTKIYLDFSYVVGRDELNIRLSTDADLQAIIVCTPIERSIINEIKAQRSQQNIILALNGDPMTDSDRCYLESMGLRMIVGRNDQPLQQVVQTVHQAIMTRASTPFADALTKYIRAGRDSWHTPGHFGGSSLSHSKWAKPFYDLVGPNVFALDLSVSVAELDSLHEPHSVLARAKALAAETFGAKDTFFATNGSSTANKVILQALTLPGDKLLVDRGSHKSVHHGIIMSGAEPIWLKPSCNYDLGLMGPVAQCEILSAIDKHPDAKLIFLTSCTYDGLRYDLTPIVEAAHRHGIKVVVDEAWYAHGYFHSRLRPTALECGADYVTQSTHKVLSAFSQASMIHVNDPEFDRHRFQEYFNMHASTSPQYSMLASLDIARMQASMEGFARLENALSLAQKLRDAIEDMPGFHVLEASGIIAPELVNDNISFDPTKITIDLRDSKFTGDELQTLLLEKHLIQVEKYTEHTLSLLVTIGTTESKVERLIAALNSILITSKTSSTFNAHRLPKLPTPEIAYSRPRDALKQRVEDVALKSRDGSINKELIGRVVQDLIAPYPPGVPLLTPGEKVNQEILEWLSRWQATDDHAEIHGLNWIEGVAYLRCCIED